jgi:hypothetical protein
MHRIYISVASDYYPFANVRQMEFVLGEFVGKRSSKQKLNVRLAYERKYGCVGLPLDYQSFWRHIDDIMPKVPLTKHMVRV